MGEAKKETYTGEVELRSVAVATHVLCVMHLSRALSPSMQMACRAFENTRGYRSVLLSA